MSTPRLVAGGLLVQLWRSRTAIAALCICVMLSVTAALGSWYQMHQSESLRLRLQQAADASFDAQPDRHPHRVVHYGHFVYRPVAQLAAFDPGVESWTGRGLFMEGHRQNSANFADARQSSLLLRFGQLSPAHVLQVLLPLLLVFIGHACVTAEREQGIWRQQVLLGVRPRDLLGGKMLGLLLAGILMAAPAWVLLGWIGLSSPEQVVPAALLAACYLLWVGLWAVLVVAVSARSGSSRAALLTLLCIWCISTILLPRLGSQVAANHPELPSRVASEIRIDADLREMGDSHDPNDPHFAQFRNQTLQRYGVSRVEDMPVNFRGLLAVEGERLSAALFDRYAAERFAAESTQLGTARLVTLANPATLLAQVSSELSGTNLAAWHDFLVQAERYRFDLVQRLNQLQADAVHAVDDAAKSADHSADQRSRISASHWSALPDFRYEPPPLDREKLSRVWSALGGLLAWVALSLWLVYGSPRS